MAAETGTSEEQGLLYRPSWVIASVAAIFIIISLILERGLHFIGKVLEKREKKGLEEAFEKIKQELMMVGFISLALTIGQTKVTEICMPEGWANKMTLCRSSSTTVKATIGRRLLAAAPTEVTCKAGQVQFISAEGLHQLHIYIFVLAVVHVVYSVVTMVLGIWKVNQWKDWEEISNQAERSSHGVVRYTKESSFVQSNAPGMWSRNVFLAYVVAFFQQFFKSVTETDYRTLRHGFIVNHLSEHANFDFHKYILRSLEDDFQHVIGISPALWGYTVVLLIFNVHGWNTQFWISFVPFILVLVIGMKLRYIITKMAVHLTEKMAVIEGIPTVMLCDELFWFNRPRLTISLVHFITYQNSSEIAFYIWRKLTFPGEICLNEERYFVISRLILGVLGQAICSYITLPIHALVSQMGSHLKKSLFKPETQLALTNWQKVAKDKIQNKRTMSLQDENRVSLKKNQGHAELEAHHQLVQPGNQV